MLLLKKPFKNKSELPSIKDLYIIMKKENLLSNKTRESDDKTYKGSIISFWIMFKFLLVINLREKTFRVDATKLISLNSY